MAVAVACNKVKTHNKYERKTVIAVWDSGKSCGQRMMLAGVLIEGVLIERVCWEGVLIEDMFIEACGKLSNINEQYIPSIG